MLVYVADFLRFPQAESAETMSLAESRRSARVQHLQAFRENLEKRVKARAEQQMALEEVRDGLFVCIV